MTLPSRADVLNPIRLHMPYGVTGTPRPFPIETLLERCGFDNLTELAHSTGMNARSAYRFRASGLTDAQADTLAVALGKHPLEVWDNWLTEAPDDDEDET